MTSDGFMVTADFAAYCLAQRDVDAMWRDTPSWRAKAIHNTANMAWFSADRTIREYARSHLERPGRIGTVGVANTGAPLPPRESGTVTR